MACCQHGLCPDSAEHGALVTSLLTHMHFGCHTCRTTRTVHAGHAHTIQCHPSNAVGSEVTASALAGHTRKEEFKWRGDMINTSGSHNMTKAVALCMIAIGCTQRPGLTRAKAHPGWLCTRMKHNTHYTQELSYLLHLPHISPLAHTQHTHTHTRTL